MSDVREKLKAQYGALYTEVEAILFHHDLMALSFGANTDEYAPEVDTILPRLSVGMESVHIANVIFEEFCRWFDEGFAREVSPQRYQAVADEVLQAWQRFQT